MLSDPVIRFALLRKLRNSSIRPKAIIEELRVHNGNAIADVVAVYSDAHCYEIKGDNDKIERALEQGKYYDLAFRKITLVTTAKHSAKAEKIIPAYWGLIEAKEQNDRITLRNLRPANKNPHYDKKIALLTLWRKELAEIAVDINGQFSYKSTRESLSKLISNSLCRDKLSLSISSKLASRALEKI